MIIQNLKINNNKLILFLLIILYNIKLNYNIIIN